VSTGCLSPIAFETLVAYWAGDLEQAESDAVEEHVMGCASCTAASARVAAVSEGLRAQLPPVLSQEGVAKLRARGVRIADNPVLPGERKPAVFTADIDVLLHRLGGLDLARAARVDVMVSVEETGDVIMQNFDVPFERDTGEVLVACVKHFSAFPPNIAFSVRARDDAGNETVTSYVVPHVFG
jgi:hypothetical protein